LALGYWVLAKSKPQIQITKEQAFGPWPLAKIKSKTFGTGIHGTPGQVSRQQGRD